jgi:hypothetical protein
MIACGLTIIGSRWAIITVWGGGTLGIFNIRFEMYNKNRDITWKCYSNEVILFQILKITTKEFERW